MDKRILNGQQNLTAPGELKVTANITIATADTKVPLTLNGQQNLVSRGEIQSKSPNVNVTNYGERGS